MTRPGRRFPRGWKLALAIAALGILVLSAAALALREPLLETWHLHRLGSEDPRVQAAAAEGLGRLRSLEAIGPLLARTRSPHFGFHEVTRAAISALEEIARGRGKDAAPFLESALATENDPFARSVASKLLRSVDPSAAPDEPAGDGADGPPRPSSTPPRERSRTEGGEEP